MKLKKVLPIIAMLLVVLITGCKKDDLPGVLPIVTSTNPINEATDVAINSTISATFSLVMDPSTITTANFTLKKGAATVSGAVELTDKMATFTPETNLDPNVLYTATITTGVKDISGVSLAKNYVWTFTTSALSDLTPPTVTLSDPLNDATGVTLNHLIVITFSEPMNPTTITSLSFTLKQGSTAVSGAITYSGTTATYTPASNLEPNKVYTATITTGAKDMAGNALASNHTFSFTTGDVADTVLPMVYSIDPLNNVTGVALNKVISLTFSEAMDPLTINTSTFTLKQGETTVSGIVALDLTGITATYTPSSILDFNTVYTATITIGAKDLAGNALAANTVWVFTTVSAPPTVISTDPLDLATGVVLNKVISATFSVAMDQSTITASTFTLMDGTTPILGVVNYSGTTATFEPNSNLIADKTYTATITTGAKSVPGIALANDYVWSFTTAPSPSGLAVVDLLTAGNYVIFSNTAISNPNANSTITGNIGTGPGVTSTAITGFSLILPAGGSYSTSSQVVGGGKVYAFDYAVPTPTDVNTASNDMLTAYTDAAGRAPDFTELYAGDISGKTLAPGVYKWSNSVVINSDVTIQGSATDVWIFQISGDLDIAAGGTIPSGIKVLLSGGALASKIFWQVAGPTGATLGTYSTFNGTILSAKQIILNTGAVFNGKALAQTQVSLDGNSVQP